MNRDERSERTERHARPDAENGDERFPQEDAADQYDGGVLEELEAHQFFHPPSVRWYRSLFSDRNSGEGQDLGDVEFLHHRGLVVECGDRLAPTRAAVLVFGRPRYVRQVLPRPVIDCQFIGAAYDDGPPERHWTDRIVVEENLLQAWLTIAERYMRHAERPFSIDTRTLRGDDDPPGYTSFREALINQLIHQDYGDRGRTAFIRFYRDRTVFWNPGDASAPARELLDRTAKEVRNPLIAAAFRGIGLARQAGTGMRAIFRDWQSLGHGPPVIRSDEGRSEFELSLLGEGVGAGGAQAEDLRPTVEPGPAVGTGGGRAADRGGDERPAAPPRADLADMVSDHGDQVWPDVEGDQAAGRLTARQRAIVAECDVPRSLAELMERAGVSHRSHFRRKHLKPLLEAGLVQMTNPANPRAPNQQYALTDAGAALKDRWAVR
ncbi:MAG: hypothetical protein OXI76_15130 [Gemmatimonadota bacterium]|nr:hypothetical protein [Gemmatimonadota bacterium]